MRGLSLVATSGGHSSSRCAGLSLSRPLFLRSTGSRCAGSVIVAHGPSCSAACGILPGQGSNPCPLHWQADSQPLRHQGSPTFFFLRTRNSFNQYVPCTHCVPGPMLSTPHSHLPSCFQQPDEAKTHHYPHFTDKETGAQKLAQGHTAGERWGWDVEPGLSDSLGVRTLSNPPLSTSRPHSEVADHGSGLI